MEPHPPSPGNENAADITQLIMCQLLSVCRPAAAGSLIFERVGDVRLGFKCLEVRAKLASRRIEGRTVGPFGFLGCFGSETPV